MGRDMDLKKEWDRISDEVNAGAFTPEFVAEVTRLTDKDIEDVYDIIIGRMCCGYSYEIVENPDWNYEKWMFVYSYGH